jgi:hypothetical protein
MVFRTESADTQRQAFREIVDIVTLFPGLRAQLLHAKYIKGATSTVGVPLRPTSLDMHNGSGFPVFLTQFFVFPPEFFCSRHIFW